MDHSAKLAKGTGVMLGAVALAALPAAPEAAFVIETFPDNNNVFDGTQELAASDTMNGFVGVDPDTIDFYAWINFPAGGTYTVSLENIDQGPFGELPDLKAQQYLTAGTTDGFVVVPDNDTDSFSGPIPGTGRVVIGVTRSDLDSGGPESYRLTLTATPPAGVPQPAALALLTAGLIGLGLHRARRRRD